MSQFPIIILGVLALAITVSSARLGQRLVGGDVATYGQFPWMVSLRIATTSSHTCGGSLVTPEHVLTAAHCIANDEPTPYGPERYFIVTGHLSNLAGGRVSAVSDVRIHPEYNPAASWANDVGVLKLVSPIPYTATERPIPIASADVGVQPCVASGWGRTIHPGSSLPSQLQTQVLNTMTRESCIQFWAASSIYNSTLCVGGIRGNGVCSGDSGGPIICNGELAGVASWTNLCANGRPDAFARVYSFRDWIAANIADLSPLGKIYAASIPN